MAENSWWDWIINIATGMAEIFDTLVQYGIISQVEADDMQNQNLTREEIAALVDQRIAITEGWQKWLPWIITGGLGASLIYVLWRRK